MQNYFSLKILKTTSKKIDIICFYTFHNTYIKKMILYDIKVNPKTKNDQTMNPKKLGIFTPFSSAMARTIKFGAFPIYEKAPIKTAPDEIANKVELSSCIRTSGLPPATSKKTKYVGALSKKADRKPVTQKYIMSL